MSACFEPPLPVPNKKRYNTTKGFTATSIDIFTTSEAKEMLNALCLRQHRILPSKIERIILDKKRTDGHPATTSPLWLSLAVYMLMAVDNDDFEKMSQLEGRGDQQIESYLMAMANGFDPLPGPLFLSLKNKAGMLFGETFTNTVFNYIAVSRNGLREKDLEKLLPAGNIDWDTLRFANLRRWFKAHLILQGEELQWNLAHSILKNTLLEKLTENEDIKIHYWVANHFLSLPDTDILKISETMFHLIQADKRELAANYYGSYWWNTLQTASSSKVMAVALILNEALNRTDSLNWVLSLMDLVGDDNDKKRTLLNNFIFSLFDLNLQSDTTISTRLKLIIGVSEQMEELRRRAPDSADYARDLSVSYNQLGDLYIQLDDPPKALDKFQASLNIREELRSRAPDSADYARNLSISYDKLGDLYIRLGDPPKALEKYQASLNIAEYLRGRAPDSADYARDLSVSYERFGSIHQAMGQMEEALKYFEKCSDLGKELYKANPRSEPLKHGLAISFSKLGEIHLAMGQMEEALNYFKEYQMLSEELYEANPQNINLLEGLGISYYQLSMVYKSIGNNSKGQEHFAQWKNIIAVLAKNLPQIQKYQQWNELEF